MDEPPLTLRKIWWARAGTASVPAYFESSIAWAGNKPKRSWLQAAEHVGAAKRLTHPTPYFQALKDEIGLHWQGQERRTDLRDRLHGHVRDAEKGTWEMLALDSKINDGAPTPWTQEALRFTKASQLVLVSDQSYTPPQGMYPTDGSPKTRHHTKEEVIRSHLAERRALKAWRAYMLSAHSLFGGRPFGTPDTQDTQHILEAYAALDAFVAAGWLFNTPKHDPLTDTNFKQAFKEYLADPGAADATYGPIEEWDTSLVTNMSTLFADDATPHPGAETFNANIGKWNTSAVTDMRWMFLDATAFNRPIGNWNTSAVTDMRHMFQNATAFNQPIAKWDTGAVTFMRSMFSNATAFNQPIEDWNTANVTNMEFMFRSASSFNQPIGKWNTANVTDMGHMFYHATAFNQPIGKWDTGKVQYMEAMFQRAKAMSDCSKASIGHSFGFNPLGHKQVWSRLKECSPPDPDSSDDDTPISVQYEKQAISHKRKAAEQAPPKKAAKKTAAKKPTKNKLKDVYRLTTLFDGDGDIVKVVVCRINRNKAIAGEIEPISKDKDSDEPPFWGVWLTLNEEEGVHLGSGRSDRDGPYGYGFISDGDTPEDVAKILLQEKHQNGFGNYVFWEGHEKGMSFPIRNDVLLIDTELWNAITPNTRERLLRDSFAKTVYIVTYGNSHL
tara:strand:- start:706 stop:2712 length:2007 start_codon:yes stop_codon:yes gene_type:complete